MTLEYIFIAGIVACVVTPHVAYFLLVKVICNRKG